MVRVGRAAAVAGALATTVHAGGIFNNQYVASKIHEVGLAFADGEYYLRNAATGDYLGFHGTNLESLVPSTTKYTVELEGNAEFHNQIRISKPLGSDRKCLSAQWDTEHEGGVDHSVGSFLCTVGSQQRPGKSIESRKQWWYLIPAETKIQVPEGEVLRRRGSEVYVYLTPLDHIADMQTRALSSKTLETPEGPVNTLLDYWSPGKEEQLWAVIPKAEGDAQLD